MDSKVSNMVKVDHLSEARLWKSLDSISDRLTGIENKLSEVVRLEERVNHHDETLTRHGRRLDNHDSRIREVEIVQANQGDRSSLDRLILNIQEEIKVLNDDLHCVKRKQGIIKETQDVSKGQKSTTTEILKWVAGIVGIIIAYKITRG